MKSEKQRILNVDGHGAPTEMAPLFFEIQSGGVIIAKKMAEGCVPATSGRFDPYKLGATFTEDRASNSRDVTGLSTLCPASSLFGRSSPREGP